MKPINLISIINAKERLDKTVFNDYLDKFGIKKMRESELDDLSSLVDSLKDNDLDIKFFDQYYLGFIIDQIGKEFDLLRLGVECIINIELKQKNTGEKIREQLIKNKYYLGFLGRSIYSFTYVSEDKILYFLNEMDELLEVDFQKLISLLENQNLDQITNIQNLFNPANYLISPFNSTDKFMEHKYFLTDQQTLFKKEIEQLIESKEEIFICIEGAAGTGKTLLAYDIAKHYMECSKSRILIIHCGLLNEGHDILIKDYLWPIIPVKELKDIDIEKYDLILVDEAQRMYTNQLETLIDKVKGAKKKCIFSYDKMQCLSSIEINSNIPEYIRENASPEYFKLTEKIRTNKEIASFIKNLFNLSKINNDIRYSNIDIQYFSDNQDAVQYMIMLKENDWKIINYTPSIYEYYPYEKFKCFGNENAHEVIGQEFDNVVAVLDKHFYYKKDKTLSTRRYSLKPYYHPSKMLFQILTRTRNKLTIIIINNEEMLRVCLEILKYKS